LSRNEPVSPQEERNRLEHYPNVLEELIASEKASEIADMEIRALRVPEEVRGDFRAEFYPIHWEEIFETRLRLSFLVSLISFVESLCVRICDNTAIITRSRLSFADLRGTTLERAQKFLTIFGAFSLPSEAQWTAMKHLTDIRNVIVHNEGRIDGYQHATRLKAYVDRSSSVRDIAGHLDLDKDFSGKCVGEIRDFMTGALEELQGLCKRTLAHEKPMERE
jgi:hypothetical protein